VLFNTDIIYHFYNILGVAILSGIANRPLTGLPRSRSLIPGRDKGCFFIPKLLNRSAQLPIHSVKGALSPLVNLLGRGTDHSFVVDKNERMHTSPPIRLHGLHRDDSVLCNILEHKYVM
jgi:hypothetical protein